MTSADAVIAWARGLSPAAGGTRVVAVEGRSGAGKTELALRLAAALSAPLIRMDDLYPGWDGLRGGVTALHDWVLKPLADGEPVRWRSWDWAADRYAGWHEVPRGDSLVVEGVGCGARVLAPYISGLVWIEVPDALRRERALARDGATYEPHWERWARQEDEFYGTDDVRGRADLIIDGSVER
ncbi:dephospho-CoA kinase [Paractinoplanes atraurantiacus]|uniref:Dephospho-CoA kinase n=1 Tax=Paractinoplanes atraurantiacus TaxID=1036182 RepID=A0A285K7E5_9ACTN|nr:dephospho-CoA kinase [Actinoplanes atraurantiacus]SNY68499.1 Dephospho-CoA kinase [Actinoplanes atraurantiacus]